MAKVMEFPEFLHANVGLDPQELEDRHGPAVLVVASVHPDDESESRFDTLLSDDSMKSMHMEMDEFLVMPFGVEQGSSFLYSVGRTRRSQLRVNDPTVSKFHAFFRWDPSTAELTLTDAGSTGGTWVEDDKLEPNIARVLEGGEVVKFGPAVEGIIHRPKSLVAYLERMNQYALAKKDRSDGPSALG